MYIPRIKPISTKRLNQLMRDHGDVKYRQWRKEVLARDGKVCQMPGCSSKQKLEVHHIKRFIDNKHLKTEKFNGITLCRKCHRGIQHNEAKYESVFMQIVLVNDKREQQIKADKAAEAAASKTDQNPS